VDPEKAAFLDDAGDDPELDESGGVAASQVAFRDAIGQQIVDDDPPQVWRTAQRLLGDGMAAPDAWRQLVLRSARALLPRRTRAPGSTATATFPPSIGSRCPPPSG
jgi:hypothetical protein